MKKALIAVAVCLMVAGGARASLLINETITYTDAQDAGAGTVKIGTSVSDITVTLDGSGTFSNIGNWMQVARADTGGQAKNITLQLTNSASLSTSFAFCIAYKLGASGTLEVTSGTGTFSSTQNYIGYGHGTGGSGSVVISGASSSLSFGQLNVGNQYGTLYGEGYFDQQNGTVSVTGDLVMGFGAAGTSSGEYTISGGSLTVGDDLDLDESGTGLFHVDGSGASSISVNGLLTNASGSTLKFTFDSGGVTPITVAGGSLPSVAGTVDIELDGFTPTENTWYDLITGGASEADISSLSLAAGDETDWTLGATEDGKVQVGYMIPEPATMGLLGLGILGLVLRRRR